MRALIIDFLSLIYLFLSQLTTASYAGPSPPSLPPSLPHLLAELHLQLNRIGHLGDNIDNRPHDFGGLGLRNQSEKLITLLEEGHDLAEAVGVGMQLGKAIDGFFLDALRGFIVPVGGVEDGVESSDGLGGVRLRFFFCGFQGFLEGVGLVFFFLLVGVGKGGEGGEGCEGDVIRERAGIGGKRSAGAEREETLKHVQAEWP